MARKLNDFLSYTIKRFFRDPEVRRELWGFVGGATDGSGGGSSITTANTVTGRYIQVDRDNPNATDTRVGLSNYSTTSPFKTIQAAANVMLTGDCIVVNRSTSSYARFTLPNSAGNFNVILKGVVIDGGNTSCILNPNAGSVLYVYIQDGAYLTSLGNAGDLDNSATIVSAGTLKVLSNVGDPMTGSGGSTSNPTPRGEIVNFASYAINCSNANAVELHGVTLGGKYTFHQNTGAFCGCCAISIRSGGWITSNSAKFFRFENCQIWSNAGGTLLFGLAAGAKYKFYGCVVYSFTGYVMNSSGNTAATTIQFNKCDVFAQYDAFIINSPHASSKFEFIQNKIHSQYGVTLNIQGVTGNANILQNSFNIAPTVACPTTTTIASTNVVYSDPSSNFQPFASVEFPDIEKM
jgi:hypothetical protein